MVRNFTLLMGQSTTFNEDIRATYFQLKKEYDFEKDIIESNYNTSIDDLMKAYNISNGNEKPQDVNDRNKTQYFDEDGIYFYGKDGVSDAYTKAGLDNDIVSYFDRQEINRRVWRFSTSASDIEFRAGGKVLIGEKPWIILKVINQLKTNDIENNIKTRTNTTLLENWGYKILVLG